MFYHFEFHVDLENIIDGIKRPVIHFSNDGRIECNEDKVIKLFEERKKLLSMIGKRRKKKSSIRKKLRKKTSTNEEKS